MHALPEPCSSYTHIVWLCVDGCAMEHVVLCSWQLLLCFVHTLVEQVTLLITMADPHSYVCCFVLLQSLKHAHGAQALTKQQESCNSSSSSCYRSCSTWQLLYHVRNRRDHASCLIPEPQAQADLSHLSVAILPKSCTTPASDCSSSCSSSSLHAAATVNSMFAPRCRLLLQARSNTSKKLHPGPYAHNTSSMHFPRSFKILEPDNLSLYICSQQLLPDDDCSRHTSRGAALSSTSCVEEESSEQSCGDPCSTAAAYALLHLKTGSPSCPA